MAVSECHQMAALVAGLKTSLYMTNRLMVYLEYHAELHVSAATSSFRTAIADLYALILRFLANAIITLPKSTTLRTMQALWSIGEDQDFDAQCNAKCQHVEGGAQACDRELSARERQQAKELRDRLYASLADLQRLQHLPSAVNGLHDNIVFDKLSPISGATFDSHEEEHNARCLPGTRVELLQQIKEWGDAYESEQVFWLCGRAGTGKSTISRTVARDLHNRDLLAASFFFKRGEGDRCRANRLFTTLAAQLGHSMPSIRQSIVNALTRDPDVTSKALSEQFKCLILEPLSAANDVPTDPPVVVIDALDEIDKEADVHTILSLLRQLGQTNPRIRLRLFVTSRPELPIRLGFSKMMKETYRDIALHEVAPPVIERDIALYLQHEFAAIRANHLEAHPTLPLDWPGEDAVRTLVERAVPLFIFAATTCRFIGSLKGNPRGRLEMMLKSESSSMKLRQTYQPVLEQLLDQDEGSADGELADHMTFIGSIVMLAEPLSANSISRLLDTDRDDVRTRLGWLHSVLSVPKDPDAPVRPFHLSFREFLVDPSEHGKSHFWVNEKSTHESLAARCIELLSSPGLLKQDICGLDAPGTRRAKVSEYNVQAAIPAEVAYACRYWVHHVQHSGQHPVDNGSIHKFLQTHFLHWIEALSWLGDLSGVIAQISSLRNDIEVCYARVSVTRMISQHLTFASTAKDLQLSWTMRSGSYYSFGLL